MKPPEKSSSSATSRGSSVVKNHKDFVRKLIGEDWGKKKQGIIHTRLCGHHQSGLSPSATDFFFFFFFFFFFSISHFMSFFFFFVFFV